MASPNSKNKSVKPLPCLSHTYTLSLHLSDGDIGKGDTTPLRGGEFTLEDGGGSGTHVEHVGAADGVAEGLDVVGLDGPAVQGGGAVGADDAGVDVGTRSKVVEDTGQDGTLDKVDGLGLRHALGPAGLKDRHGGERTGAHGGVGEPVWFVSVEGNEDNKSCVSQ